MLSKLRDTHFITSRPVLDLCHCGSSHKDDSSSFCDGGDARPEDLSPRHRESLQSFRDCLQDQGLLAKNVSDADLLRFLRARSFDIGKATLMYEAMLEWRNKVDADKIIESFQFPERRAIKELYPHFHHKTDKFGRPIYIERLGHLQLDEILKITTMDRMLTYHIKEWEILINWKFPACSKKAGRQIMQSLTILDVKGVAMKAMNKQVRSFIQKISKIDQDYYPEYLGKMFIVNAPTAFKAVWAVIKPWLDKRTQRKIEVHGSNFTPKLLELVDSENLPEFLGGTCHCTEGCESSDAGPWKEIPFVQYYDARLLKHEDQHQEEYLPQ
ncbi:hypothetical protein KP509_24G034600 [Ceratopteris richardii]|uniref:CRAL-TRIO domain-containing protein n=1 Tax=Ceratopteris richardii TaxID=49495 RepID=A0A8T2RTN4_CERRI|nr:hypothetical protein KP509_24G034600 [Ceratopteris richardii]